MESIYTELALYSSNKQYARTDTVFLPISEVCNGTVSVTMARYKYIYPILHIYIYIHIYIHIYIFHSLPSFLILLYTLTNNYSNFRESQSKDKAKEIPPTPKKKLEVGLKLAGRDVIIM